MLRRIQYITHPQENFEDLSWVHRLHENGIHWIQLRIKEPDLMLLKPQTHYLAYFHEVAEKMRAITSALGMTLTINDHPQIAWFANADGVHVGQSDDWSNLTLSGDLILGLTAHNLAELQRFPHPITYAGVGPLRSTQTKSDTKAALGTKGYREFVEQLEHENMNIPVFAIGGITPADVPDLLHAGVYGLAICGSIFHANHSPEAIRSFTSQIEKYDTKNS